MPKLLDIRYRTQVGSLGRENPYAPINEARAINAAVGEVKSSAEKIYTRHLELTEQSMNLELQKEVSDWETKFKDKQFYTASELPDDIDLKKTHTVVDDYGNKSEVIRDQIPSYEVYPELYRRKVQAVIDAQSERMSNEKIRNKWHTAATSILNEKYANALTQASKEIEKYQERKTLSNVQDAVDSGNYLLAQELAKQLKDPVLKQEQLKAINKVEETGDYSGAIRTENLEQLYGSLDFLNLENYHNVGYLSEQERMIWAARIQTKIHQIEARNKVDDSASVELLKHEARAVIEGLNYGDDYTPDYLTKLNNRLMDRFDKSGVPSLVVDLHNASNFRAEMYPVLEQVPYSQRDRMIQEAKSKLTDSPYDMQKLRQLEKMSDADEQLRQSDPYTHAVRRGIVNPEKDYPPIDYKNLAGSIQARVPVASKIEELNGYSKGFFTAPEAFEIARRIENSTGEVQDKLLRDIMVGAGDKYSAVFEQLADHGLNGAYVAIGVASAEGDLLSANTIRRGQERLKDKNIQWLNKDTRVNLNEHMIEKFSKSYPMSEAYRSIMMQAMTAAYVAQLDLESKEDVSLDDTKAEKAFEMVTGGLVEHKGSVNLPPKRGFGQDNWDRYFKGNNSFYHTELLRMNGGAKPINYTTEELATLIKKGDAQLVDSGLFSSNKYYILHQGKLVLGSNGKEYEFKYLPDVLTVGTVRKENESERLARRASETKSQKEIVMESSWLLNFIERMKNKK